MLDHEWEKALSQWAHARSDIKALVQIGSRVQAAGKPDQWSDYDYQLITSRPDRYLDGSFARQIANCWSSGINRAFGNVTRVSAVYSGALEAEFVILKRWEVFVAATALRWPQLERVWPEALKRGIQDFRGVAGSGWRILKGGEIWERRYRRLNFFQERITHYEFEQLCGEFWSQLVWAVKKVQRGEFLAAQRAIHEVLLERTLSLLSEEALLDGKPTGPRGRRAEDWLCSARLQAVKIVSYPDRPSLITALQQIVALFEKVSEVVSTRHGWDCDSYSEARTWFRSQFSPQA